MGAPDPGVAARRAAVLSLWKSGWKSPEIAERVGASRHAVNMDIYHLRQTGADMPRRKRQPKVPEVQKRRKRVAELWRQGRTSAEIAERLGVPVSRIETDLRWMRVGGRLDGHDPHQHPSRVKRRTRVAELWREGWKANEIAEELGVRRSTVYMDIERLREEGEDMPFRIPALVGNRSQKNTAT